MIFVSFGTHEQPFERLLDLVEPLAGEDHRLMVQHGSTPPRFGLPDIAWHPFMEIDEVQAAMRSAELVICHAGVGTIITALRLGKRPLVVPRRAAMAEHVDDHQMDIAARLAERGLIVLVQDPADLHRALWRDPVDPAREMPRQNPRLRAAVRAAAGEGPSPDWRP